MKCDYKILTVIEFVLKCVVLFVLVTSRWHRQPDFIFPVFESISRICFGVAVVAIKADPVIGFSIGRYTPTPDPDTLNTIEISLQKAHSFE